MSKFKVGDKVRYVRHEKFYRSWFTFEKIYTIVGIGYGNNPMLIDDEGDYSYIDQRECELVREIDKPMAHMFNGESHE